MLKYRVLIQGQNFLINLDGANKKLGFYTTRYVEADNVKDAEHKSIELIRNDQSLKQTVLNSKDDLPMIYIDETTEIESFDGVDMTEIGFAWYPNEPDG